MSKPFDAALKALLEASPADWPRLAGFKPAAVEIIDADVSTVTAATDKVLRLAGPEPTLMHFDFQAGPDAGLPRRMLGYNALLGQRHGLPVHSVIVLLRPQANLVGIDGLHEQHYPGRPAPYLTFRYQVVRVWELAPADLLHGGIGTLALAPIGAVTPEELPGVMRAVKQRLGQADVEKIAGELWTAIRVLLGLRYEPLLIKQLLRGVHRMKESVTYQEILNEGRVEGRVEEARRILLKMGENAFEQPANAVTRAALEAINSPETLEQLLDQLRHARSWEELLPTEPRPSRGRKKKS
jgi:predicted transposase YdaD